MPATAFRRDFALSKWRSTGLTDLEYTLTVTDQVNGAVRTYAGGATGGTRLCGAADTAAFRN